MEPGYRRPIALHDHPLTGRIAARVHARPSRGDSFISTTIALLSTFLLFVAPWLGLIALGIAVAADAVPAEVLVVVVIAGGVLVLTLLGPTPRDEDPGPAASTPAPEDDEGEGPGGGGGGGGGGPRNEPPEPSSPTGPGIDWDQFDRERDSWTAPLPAGV